MKNKMKKDLISITEYARLRGVTTETLRHYDRIGLFKPAHVDPETGERYYSLLFEYEKLGTILELKQLDMSLSEIREFLDGRNLRKSLDILNKKKEAMGNKIDDLENRYKVLCERISSIEAYLESIFDFRKITVKRVGRRSALISNTKFRDDEEALINRDAILMENHMIDMAPLIGGERFALIISTDDVESGEPTFRVALIVDNLKQNNPDVSFVEGGLYACKMRYGDSLNIVDDYDAIREFCEKEQYEIYGDAIEILTVDMSITDIPEENIYELQVPVRKKEEKNDTSIF